MLKLLTDENVALLVLKTLRNNGFSVLDIKEKKLYGIDDNKVLRLAKKDKRIIITHDSDFLDYPLNQHQGLILLKFKNQSPKNVIKYLLPFIKSRKTKLKNKTVIINEEWVKMW